MTTFDAFEADLRAGPQGQPRAVAFPGCPQLKLPRGFRKAAPSLRHLLSPGTPSPRFFLFLLLQGFAREFLNICIFQCWLSVGNQGCLVKAETFSKCKSGKKLPFLCALQLSQQNDSFLPSIVSNLFFNRKKTLKRYSKNAGLMPFLFSL